MRNLIAVCVIALLWSCGPSLKRGGWEEDTYKVLSGVIASSENCAAYAVFDCDKGGEIDELASLRDGRYISQKFPKQ